MRARKSGSKGKDSRTLPAPAAVILVTVAASGRALAGSGALLAVGPNVNITLIIEHTEMEL